MSKSAFVKTFGAAPIIKVLDALIENEMFDLSKSELAELSDISRVKLNEIFPRLVKSKILIFSRQVGRAKMYKLSPKSPIVKRLMALEEAVNKQQRDEILKKEKSVA